MRTKMASMLLAGSLGLTGAALLTPSIASAQEATTTESGPLAALRNALAALVSDGTITQPQADAVAERLATDLPQRGPGGFGGRHGGPGGRGGPGGVSAEAAAEALGLTVEELRSAQQQGQTLAEIAEDEGVARDVLVDALVAAAQERLDAAVESGRITQEQAEAAGADLEQRVEEQIDEVCEPGGRGGRGPGRGPDADGEQTPETGTPTPETNTSDA